MNKPIKLDELTQLVQTLGGWRTILTPGYELSAADEKLLREAGLSMELLLKLKHLESLTPRQIAIQELSIDLYITWKRTLPGCEVPKRYSASGPPPPTMFVIEHFWTRADPRMAKLGIKRKDLKTEMLNKANYKDAAILWDQIAVD